MDEKTIFLAALEITEPTQRQAYVDAACRGQSQLRQGVERLLAAQPPEGDFLETPPPVVAMAMGEFAPNTVASDLTYLTPSSRPDSIGRLGHYEVLQVVGSGGFGVVLKALDEKLLRVVAIKVLAVVLAASATARKRFVREAQAAAAVNHDNVVDIYAVEETGPVPYLVMEYVAGISLEEKLQQHGPLELREILRIGLQTAEGLAAAHRQGLVHRDVKPANILLENGVMRVKITDFGLARAVDDASLTQAGIIAGTPTYMSPEQARGAAVDHRSDLFSLGSVMYAMCAGQSPFKASTSLGAIKRVCEDQPRALHEVNPDVPNWLCNLIEKLLAKNPGDRYQTTAEVVDLLSRGLAHVQQPALKLPPDLQRVEVPTQRKVHRPAARSIFRAARSRWWVTAALLGLVVAGFCLAEGTGASHVTATVIRVLTPHGTMVVEVSDPGISVTVEGNGDELVITGAGVHELRLRPGQHHVRAAKEGRPIPVDQPLVTIDRGGKQIVKVVREATPSLSLAESPLLAALARRIADVERNPGDLKARFERILAYARLNRLDEALSDYSYVINAQPDSPEYSGAYMGRGEIRQGRGDWAGAIADFGRRAALTPHEGRATGHLALIYLFGPSEHRDPQKAAQHAELAARAEPKNHGYVTIQGIACYRLGRLDEAVQTLERATALPPGADSRDLYALAMCYHAQGQADKAHACHAQAAQAWERTKSAQQATQLAFWQTFHEEAEAMLAVP